MSREYAESRIKEALKLAKGNPTKARQQVIAWAGQDARLLQALTKPHMTGIVAHAVNYVITHASSEVPEDIPVNPQSLNMEPDTFGKEILKALQSNDTARFGREDTAPQAKRPRASQSHIDALNKMAGKSKKHDD